MPAVSCAGTCGNTVAGIDPGARRQYDQALIRILWIGSSEVPSMSVGRYRIMSPTVAVAHERGRDVACLIPEGAIIEVSSWPLDSEDLITVNWGGQSVRMFPRDLRARAVATDVAEPSGHSNPGATHPMCDVKAALFEGFMRAVESHSQSISDRPSGRRQAGITLLQAQAAFEKHCAEHGC